MPIFPVRQLAKYGVIADQDPFDIPTEAWSIAVNARFRNEKVTRGPVFRTVEPLGSTNPRFLATYNPTNGIDDLFIGYENGRVFLFTVAGGEVDWSPVLGTVVTNAGTASGNVLHFASVPGYVVAGVYVFDNTATGAITFGTTVLSTTATTVTISANVNSAVGSSDTIQFSVADNIVEGTWTSCHLADLLYINRPDRVPWYINTASTAFATIPITASPVGWDSTWRCQLLRSCAGALVALNVTKGATTFPTMVKTSSFPTSGTTPASWDQTSPSTSATENILAEMEGAIIDACPLGNNLIIYGTQEAWLMTLNPGSAEVFDYLKLPFGANKGAVYANCSVEVGGLNYVFGPEDIWVHDGVTARSICENRVRDFIYGGINAAKFPRCFVVHNSRLKEVSFCYVSQDAYVNFANAPDGCTRSATYNYENDRWAFDDLPLVYSGVRSNINQAATWATITATWGTIGGSWQDFEDGYKRAVFFVGDTNATYGLTASLYGFDVYGPGSILTFPVATAATAPLYLKRDGIDLDQVGVDLRGYKLLSSIVPQGRLDLNAAPVQFSFGTADYYGAVPVYSPYMTWDAEANYKLDYNVAGRYLSMQVLYSDYNVMSLSGFDFDMDVLGER